MHRPCCGLVDSIRGMQILTVSTALPRRTLIEHFLYVETGNAGNECITLSNTWQGKELYLAARARAEDADTARKEEPAPEEPERVPESEFNA